MNIQVIYAIGVNLYTMGVEDIEIGDIKANGTVTANVDGMVRPFALDKIRFCRDKVMVLFKVLPCRECQQAGGLCNLHMVP